MYIGNYNQKKLLESCETSFGLSKDYFQIRAKCQRRIWVQNTWEERRNLSKDIEDDVQHTEVCCPGQPGRGLLFNNAAPDLKQKSLFVFRKAFSAACPLREAETLRWLSINPKKNLKVPREVHKSVHTLYMARFSWWEVVLGKYTLELPARLCGDQHCILGLAVKNFKR